MAITSKEHYYLTDGPRVRELVHGTTDNTDTVTVQLNKPAKWCTIRNITGSMGVSLSADGKSVTLNVTTPGDFLIEGISEGSTGSVVSDDITITTGNNEGFFRDHYKFISGGVTKEVFVFETSGKDSADGAMTFTFSPTIVDPKFILLKNQGVSATLDGVLYNTSTKKITLSINNFTASDLVYVIEVWGSGKVDVENIPSVSFGTIQNRITELGAGVKIETVFVNKSSGASEVKSSFNRAQIVGGFTCINTNETSASNNPVSALTASTNQPPSGTIRTNANNTGESYYVQFISK